MCSPGVGTDSAEAGVTTHLLDLASEYHILPFLQCLIGHTNKLCPLREPPGCLS